MARHGAHRARPDAVAEAPGIRAGGGGDRASTASGILRRHIIPNTLGPVVDLTSRCWCRKAILLESLLSFLGLGVQEPLTSLGVLIAEGASNMQAADLAADLPVDLSLTLILFALNFLGDGLRDALDPKDR